MTAYVPPRVAPVRPEGVPVDLWQAAIVKAWSCHETIDDVILRALREYVREVSA